MPARTSRAGNPAAKQDRTATLCKPAHFAASLQRAAAGEYIFAATNLIEADVPALIVRVSRNFDAW
jgi:hypothetical protein